MTISLLGPLYQYSDGDWFGPALDLQGADPAVFQNWISKRRINLRDVTAEHAEQFAAEMLVETQQGFLCPNYPECDTALTESQWHERSWPTGSWPAPKPNLGARTVLCPECLYKFDWANLGDEVEICEACGKVVEGRSDHINGKCDESAEQGGDQ